MATFSNNWLTVETRVVKLPDQPLPIDPDPRRKVYWDRVAAEFWAEIPASAHDACRQFFADHEASLIDIYESGPAWRAELITFFLASQARQ